MTDFREKRIGCIGAGTMGGVIASRIAGAGGSSRLTLFDVDAEKTTRLRDTCGAEVASTIEELAQASEILILAVKPDVIVSVLDSIRAKLIPDALIISIAAGVTLATLQNAAGGEHPIARVMPNTPALIGAGMSAISHNAFCKDSILSSVTDIFSMLGKTIVLPEKLMDAVTGLSGSGPAYVFTFIQGLADAGVKCGIPRDSALLLAAQTVYGSALYCIESGIDPITLRGRVTSPGGTTIDAVHVLERSGFSGIVMDAVETAAKKSEKLGAK